MKNVLLAAGFSVLAVPAFAAGLPHVGLPTSSAGAPTASLPTLPLPPTSTDLGLSTPGFGKAQQIAPGTQELPGLADIIPYYDNTGSGGRMAADLELDTFGQTSYKPVILYGYLFTDPPKQTLKADANLDGLMLSLPPK
jgi:hypothetical protein